MMTYYLTKNDSLTHHGIKGQKWGVRRYQNQDGTYTAEGKARRKNISINAINGLNVSKRIKQAFNDPYVPTSSFKSRNTYERDLKNGDLGVRTLETLGKINFLEKPYGKGSPEEDAYTRNWFLIEDQTIGLGAVCDLVNRGYSSSEISKIIDIASELNDKLYDLDSFGKTDLDTFIWELSEVGDSGKEFAITAEKIYRTDKFIDDNKFNKIKK